VGRRNDKVKRALVVVVVLAEVWFGAAWLRMCTSTDPNFMIDPSGP
jgi:hypothetical protein